MCDLQDHSLTDEGKKYYLQKLLKVRGLAPPQTPEENKGYQHFLGSLVWNISVECSENGGGGKFSKGMNYSSYVTHPVTSNRKASTTTETKQYEQLNPLR